VIINFQNARELLQNDEVVAIPTETVYGLGAWIHSDSGLKKIFSTKERPFFDPLIVHVDGIESAKKLSSDWGEIHQALASSCWPGPLTIVTKKNQLINSLITSGLDSVGLRCPNHSLTLKLLSGIEGGIAAPSANKFGKTSPTTVQHVEDEFNSKVPILDGGPCQIGIESTVAGIQEENGQFKVKIYRPGYFTAKMLKTILEQQGLDIEVVYAQSPVAPGQLEHHYMPQIPLVIVDPSFKWNERANIVNEKMKKTFTNPILWQQPLDAHLASRELYSKMREFDQSGHDLILAIRDPHHHLEEWMGIWNRLEKAKSYSFIS